MLSGNLSAGWGCHGGSEALMLATVGGNSPKSRPRCAESKSRPALASRHERFAPVLMQ